MPCPVYVMRVRQAHRETGDERENDDKGVGEAGAKGGVHRAVGRAAVGGKKVGQGWEGRCAVVRGPPTVVCLPPREGVAGARICPVPPRVV